MKQAASIPLATALFTALLPGCGKVPLIGVDSAFPLAQAAWFEAEETLFLFYRVKAEQGISKESRIEVRWDSDEGEQAWTDIRGLTNVHIHVPVDCGAEALCGSASPLLRKRPRNVGMRLRYHHGGSLALDSDLLSNAVPDGPAWEARSFVVYGVFDSTNRRVQWRGRHVFPALRNHEAESLGLRRWFKVTEEQVDDLPQPADADLERNPYLYDYFSMAAGPSRACLPTAIAAGTQDPGETIARAKFGPDPLPDSAAPHEYACAMSSVRDGKGEFSAPALARKNPETESAFPALRSPITQNTPLRFMLAPCQRVISAEHKDMQRQRLLMSSDTQEFCTEDLAREGGSALLAAKFSAALEAARPARRDMVLVVGLQHDDASGALGRSLQAALEAVLLPESQRNTPRASGGFVFDSVAQAETPSSLQRQVLWCPATRAALPRIPGQAQDPHQQDDPEKCPVTADSFSVDLSPVDFASLPILPSRKGYLDFLGKYPVSVSGRMLDMRFLAPERTALSKDVPLAGSTYGKATFFNSERLQMAAGESLSYCAEEEKEASIVFLSPEGSALPLSSLPSAHAALPQAGYELGLAWDFPYLLRLRYERVTAGAVRAFGASVPFGIPRSGALSHGPRIWEASEFPIGTALLRCKRFCEHPSFDSAGTYAVRDGGWRVAYQDRCHRPVYPDIAQGAEGFPYDP